MKITDAFKVITNRHGQWRMVRRSAPTTDSTRRTRDLLLSAVETPKNPGLVGLAMGGAAIDQLAKLSTADRRKAFDALLRTLVNYGDTMSTELEVNPAGVLVSDRPEKEWDTSMSAKMNDANRRAWNLPAKDLGRHKSGPITPDELNQINRDFWAQERTRQEAAAGRKWGQG